MPVVETVTKLPFAEYPDEVVKKWMAEADVAEAQFANGEIVPKTAAEMAAELGIALDD